MLQSSGRLQSGIAVQAESYSTLRSMTQTDWLRTVRFRKPPASLCPMPSQD